MKLWRLHLDFISQVQEMGRGRGIARSYYTSSSLSSLESSNYPATFSSQSSHFTTDLSLGLSISSTSHHQPNPSNFPIRREEEGEGEYNSATFFVKVYMEGIPIGRKLDLLAHDGYRDLIRTLNLMFNTTIIWAEMDGEHAEQFHVLTYEDKEGDWLMVGDVPWEMFLCSVRRLKITRVET